MAAFDLAAAALFADRNLGMDAIWRQGGTGPGVAVRVIRRSPDEVLRFGDGRFVTATEVLLVRVADVPDLARGDTFTLGAEVLAVQAEPVRDARRLIWTAEVAAA